MGIRWTDLSDRQRAMINDPSMPFGRTELPVDASQETPRVERAEPKVPRLEKAEHGIFETWLIAHEYAYRHSRTDKPTRENVGAPDFTVYDKRGSLSGMGYSLAIEFKLAGNKLSAAQAAWASRYGGTVYVLPSAAEAIVLVKGAFGTPKH